MSGLKTIQTNPQPGTYRVLAAIFSWIPPELSLARVRPECVGVRARVHHLYRAPGEIQGEVRDQVEKDDADLENRHPRVVQHVELLDGKMEPSAVKQIDPVMCQDKDQKPHRQYGVVDQRAPQQRATHRLDTHNLPPVLKRPPPR